MRLPAGRRATLAIAPLLVTLSGAVGAPAWAQDAPDDERASLCVLTLDEVRDATGLPFATAAEARGACTYASDPSVDMLALDLRIDPEGDLENVRFSYDRGGRDTTVAGFPAWSSEDGLFVDVGGRLLVVQPVFFLSDAASDPVAAQVAIAELAAPRVGAAIDAAFGAEDRLRALFPPEFDGLSLFVDVMNGADFLRFVDLGTAGIEAVLSGRGMTLADLSVATTTIGAADVVAMQAPGLDASLLLPPVAEYLTTMTGKPTQETRGGRELLRFPEQGMWLYASGEVLWIISQADEPTLEAVLEVLP